MSLSRILFVTTLALSWVGLWAGAASASDGILEINRTCAFGPGCFPGDGPGLPVIITEPGSYQLTSNLDYRGENTNAILIRADDVTIDMKGFRIRCLQNGVIVIGGGEPPLCSEVGGVASGIAVDNLSLRHSAEVKNGSVVGMPNFGVRLGWHSVVRNMRVSYNDYGIQSYIGSLVENNLAFGNDTGINLQFGGGYRDNAMYANNPNNVVGGINLGGNMCNGAVCP